MKTNAMYGRPSVLAVLLLLSGVASAERATRMTVETDKVQEYIMHDSSKMYFSGDYVVLDTLGDGSKVMFPIKAIDKIQFEVVDVSGSGVTTVISASPSLSVSPNPVLGEMIVEADIDGTFDYAICDMNGQTVMKGTMKSGASVSLEALEKGVYFLKVKGSIAKFLKL